MWILEVYLVNTASDAVRVSRKKYDMIDRATQEALSIIKNGTRVNMYGGDLCIYYPAHKVDRVVVRKDDGQKEEDWGHE